MSRPIVIVGAGPAGLYLAKLLAAKGLPVYLVEKRSIYARPQVITAYKFGNDDELAEAYPSTSIPKPRFQIKELERFFDENLAEYLMLDDGGAAVEPGKVRLLKPYEYQGIDQERHKVRVAPVSGGDAVELDYQHVVDCSGAHHAVLDSLPQHGVSYIERRAQPLVPDYGFLTFHNKLPEFCFNLDRYVDSRLIVTGFLRAQESSIEFYAEELTDAQLFCVLEMIKSFPDPDDPSKTMRGWLKPRLPSAYTLPHGTGDKKIKLNFELPDSIAKLTGPRRLRLAKAYGERVLWALAHCNVWQLGRPLPFDDFKRKYIVELKRSTKKSAHDADAKQRVRATTAKIQLVRASEASVSAGGDSRLILAGDSFATAWQELASGVNAALQHVWAVAKYMSVDGVFAADSYEAFVTRQTDNIDASAKKSVESRRVIYDAQRRRLFGVFASQDNPRLRVKGAIGLLIQDCIDEYVRMLFGFGLNSDERKEYQSISNQLRDVLNTIRIGSESLKALRALVQGCRHNALSVSKSAFSREEVIRVTQQIAKRCSKLYSDCHAAANPAAEPASAPLVVPEIEPAVVPEIEPAVEPVVEAKGDEEDLPASSTVTAMIGQRDRLSAGRQGGGSASTLAKAPPEAQPKDIKTKSCCSIM